jgi:AcrR family transcriptional regulator
MTIDDRRRRERAAQRDLITSSARTIAEAEGWDAVTTRRLSTEIEYSQPVIYKHFASRDAIVEAVALEGFDELARSLGRARESAAADQVVLVVSRAYTSWAADNPVLYDAMFTGTTTFGFAIEETPAPLRAAYAELRGAVATMAGRRDVDTLTEVLWAALHGLVVLGANGRLRDGMDTERVDALVEQFRS